MPRVQLGDREAFAELVGAHQAEVLAYCARFLGDPSAAADVTQEVFLTLWRERDRYREEGRLRHWLLRVARHRCLAETKKRRSRRALSDRVAAQPAAAVEPLTGDSAALAAALAGLKPAHRDVVVLRYLEDLSLADIAAITGLRQGTIKSRLHRALARLRKELADD